MNAAMIAQPVGACQLQSGHATSRRSKQSEMAFRRIAIALYLFVRA
jgi:hypothetical protein